MDLDIFCGYAFPNKSLGLRCLTGRSLQVRLAALSCVTKDIKEPGDYGGFPAVRIIYWFRFCIFTTF